MHETWDVLFFKAANNMWLNDYYVEILMSLLHFKLQKGIIYGIIELFLYLENLLFWISFVNVLENEILHVGLFLKIKYRIKHVQYLY